MRCQCLSPIASIVLLALLPTAFSHGHQVPVSDDADWATRHMAEEHHIANLDPSAFFTLHDYDSSGQWSPDELRRTYGFDDESAKDVPLEKKSNSVQEVIGMFDKDGDGVISREEWMDGWVKEGKRLPDFGVGCHNCCKEYYAPASRLDNLARRDIIDLRCLDAFPLGMPIGHAEGQGCLCGQTLFNHCIKKGYKCYANFCCQISDWAWTSRR